MVGGIYTNYHAQNSLGSRNCEKPNVVVSSTKFTATPTILITQIIAKIKMITVSSFDFFFK